MSSDGLDLMSERADGEGTDLPAQLELLEAENARLRRELSVAHRNKYRRTAYGLCGVGLIAILGALIFPGVQTVLLALGGTGVFAGILTYYLTPERFVSATIGEQVYAALATDRAALITELDLSQNRVYVPVGRAAASARLFVPQHVEYTVPDEDELAATFVITVDERSRGVAFEPSGSALVEELRTASRVEADTIGETVAHLADGLVEMFELAARTLTDVDSERGRASVAIVDSAYGPVDRFDHPIASYLATGIATQLEEPVTLEVTTAEDDRADYLVTCRWEGKGDSENQRGGEGQQGAEGQQDAEGQQERESQQEAENQQETESQQDSETQRRF